MYSFIKNSGLNKNQIEILNIDETGFIDTSQDREILRNKKIYKWKKNDLQSFTLLRFIPPKLMNYEGYSIIVDPDVFCISEIKKNITLLIESDYILHARKNTNVGYASSVMIINNKKFKKYDIDKKIKAVFDKTIDYSDLINLNFIDPYEINILDNEWNSYDHLNDNTLLLHLTNRLTQPWKTGLKIDFTQTYNKLVHGFIPNNIYKFLQKAIFNKDIPPFKNYLPHPDSIIEKFFFEILKDALNDQFIDKKSLEEEVQKKNIRSDIFEKLKLN